MKCFIVLLLLVLTGCASIRVEKQPAKYKGLDLRSIGFCISERYYVSVLPNFKIVTYNGSGLDKLQCTRKITEIRRDDPPVEPRYTCTMNSYGMQCAPKHRTDDIDILNDR